MKLLTLTTRIKELEGQNEKLRREMDRLGDTHSQEIERLEKEQEKLRPERDDLKKELDLARRAGKRPAAPFSKGEPNAEPQKPGRKPGAGYGPKAHRPIPVQIEEEVPVIWPDSGPQCGGEIGD